MNQIRPGVIKLFSWSTQLSKIFSLLINVIMPTIVGILTLISMINTISESLNIIYCSKVGLPIHIIVSKMHSNEAILFSL